MASRSNQVQSIPVLPPPKISVSDHLLASRISLPLDPCISYSIFAPPTNSVLHAYETIETARRLILSRNSSSNLLDSLLTSVHIGTNSLLYVFHISPKSNLTVSTLRLNQLQLDGLTATETSSFMPQDLYPCSPNCSILREPCSVCLDHAISASSTASLLPRKPLRTIYSNFIEAIRIRLIDDIISVSVTKSSNTANRQAKRLRGGFLLSTPCSKNEWSMTWEHRAMARPLLYCQLQIHLVHKRGDSHPHLIIHPLLLSTSFISLGYTLPIPAGTPITLLPHGTPAFFLAKYTGPTSALTRQFHDALQGLGVSGWESSPSQMSSRKSSESPTFILAWINVENKQGEDKGIIIIYPTTLCLAFIPSSPSPCRPSRRQPLNYIPELPAPLQPSPQVPSALPASTISATPVTPASPANSSATQLREPSLPPFALSAFRRPGLSPSPSLRAFRSLTLSRSKDLQLVAIEVGGYVDAVARERERERERLRREREREASGSRTAAATPTPTAVSEPAPAAPDTPTPGALLQTQTLVGHSPLQLPAQVQQQIPPPPHLQQPQATVSQAQASTQNFYPSPPQTNPPMAPTTGQTSPVAESAQVLPEVTSPMESTEVTPSTSALITTVNTGSAAAASTSTAPYDPLNNNLDSAWSAQPQPYLGMDMDMDMDFGLDMGLGFGMGDGGDTGMDFEDAFTEDDFSFFDQPSARAPVRAGPSGLIPPLMAGPAEKTSTVGGMATGVGLIGQAMSPPLYSHDDHPGGPKLNTGSGLGPSPPLVSPVHQSPTPHSTSNSTTHLQASPFNPSTLSSYPTLPDLLPHSPGWAATPSSHPVPPTPSIHLEPDPPSTSARIFDPIPFAAYHRALDGKYAVGKFAFPFSLPSPPEEEDRAVDFTMQKISSPKLGMVDKDGIDKLGKGKEADLVESGWRSKYYAATDPRIGVIRKLIGIKRKISVQGGRDSVRGVHGTNKLTSPTWIQEHSDWEKSSSMPEVDVDSKSEASESDEDDYAESPVLSRPSTPLPAYLPHGPILLATHFEHSQLIPLTTSLRPPGAAVAPTNITIAAPAVSVPTPVSPAATMDAASEQSKSLEAAALTLATEVVENPPWADAWRVNSLRARQPPEVWPADVRTISQLLDAVPVLESPLDIGTLFGLEAQGQESGNNKTSQKPIQLLEDPMISIGKGDAVIQILPTALRFWEKLGLGPRGGRKNGTAFVLFEDDGEQRQQQVESWLSTVSAMYEGRHLGTLVPGSCSVCSKDGLVPLRFDSSFRKSLMSFVAALPASESSLIFFVITPVFTMTLVSPVLRQVFSSIKKVLRTHSEPQILFQFVPEQLIFSCIGNPSTSFSDLEVFCASLYDRILLPVDRISRREGVRKYFQEPAFTLARPIYSKVSFIHASRAPLDVMDRHTFVHIGYQVSPCGKWILAACVDQRGEAHELGVWLTQTPGEGGESEAEVSKEMFLVKKVWEFGVQFAKRANVEWRMVFSKLGAIVENEIEAWTKHLDATTTCDELSTVHISLLSVEPDTPWTFISRSNINAFPKPKPPSPKNQNQLPQNFTDITATFYALSHHHHLPQSLPPTATNLGLSHSFIPEPSATPSLSSADTQHTADQHPHHLPLLPHSTTTLICLPATPSPTSISMLHIHLLHVFPPFSIPMTTADELSKLHADITRNFHELAVLARARWRLGVNPLLPFHLAAVEAMRIALDCDWDRDRWDNVNG